MQATPKLKPKGFWVLINPEHRRFGGISWRRDKYFGARKEARAYVAQNYGPKPNRYAVKIEANY